MILSRIGRKGASILPKLKSLPPTVESFRENVKGAHFQACICKAALQQDPPELDPLEFRWASEGPSGAYFPVSLPSKVEVAPSDTAAATVTGHAPGKYAGLFTVLQL